MLTNGSTRNDSLLIILFNYQWWCKSVIPERLLITWQEICARNVKETYDYIKAKMSMWQCPTTRMCFLWHNKDVHLKLFSDTDATKIQTVPDSLQLGKTKTFLIENFFNWFTDFEPLFKNRFLKCRSHPGTIIVLPTRIRIHLWLDYWMQMWVNQTLFN